MYATQLVVFVASVTVLWLIYPCASHFVIPSSKSYTHAENKLNWIGLLTCGNAMMTAWLLENVSDIATRHALSHVPSMRVAYHRHYFRHTQSGRQYGAIGVMWNCVISLNLSANPPSYLETARVIGGKDRKLCHTVSKSNSYRLRRSLWEGQRYRAIVAESDIFAPRGPSILYLYDNGHSSAEYHEYNCQQGPCRGCEL
jgi:hypothetical protein